ncbi:transglutaminaseTgpA domain-containing protein [Demequina sediminis]|uniref:transglutaminaseTgpA domain-containing protein n=1 Tax=Demequina sediminis TaxID=1930058 RepID=UPI002574398D|nr:transglutaminaseTgpA domain-containing protein [Demequina sediminis]
MVAPGSPPLGARGRSRGRGGGRALRGRHRRSRRGLPALAAAITAGALALFLLVDAVAVGAGFAASAGFLLVVPWLPALTLERRIPTLALLGALAAWLGVVALSRRIDAGPWRSRDRAGAPAAPAAAAAVAATLLLASITAPLAVGGPGWGAAPALRSPTRSAAPRDSTSTSTCASH